MQKFLNSLDSYSAFRLLDEIGIDYYGEFHTPFLEVVGDAVVVHLDDKHEPKDENFIEITTVSYTHLTLPTTPYV